MKNTKHPKESFRIRFGKFIDKISLNFIPFTFFLNKKEIIEECKKRLTIVQEKLETIREPDLSEYKIKASRILKDIKTTAIIFKDTELASKVDQVNNMMCLQYHVAEK